MGEKVLLLWVRLSREVTSSAHLAVMGYNMYVWYTLGCRQSRYLYNVHIHVPEPSVGLHVCKGVCMCMHKRTTAMGFVCTPTYTCRHLYICISHHMVKLWFCTYKSVSTCISKCMRHMCMLYPMDGC